jgi:hypothetical protein
MIPIMLRRPTAGVAASLVLVVALSGCAVSADPARKDFPAGAPVDYQLAEAYPVPPGTGIVARDSTAEPASGVYSICYINGFQSQPGETAQWLAEHPELVLGGADDPVVDANWPDEIIFDTSTAAKRAAIAARLQSTIERCADSGFDAIEIDNLDSFMRSGGALTADDNIALVSLFAESAHRLGLAIGQKNTAELAARLRDEVGFDFAVAEECDRFAECSLYTDVYGGSVIDIEYADDLRDTFAQACARSDRPPSRVLRDRNLLPDTAAGYVFEVC